MSLHHESQTMLQEVAAYFAGAELAAPPTPQALRGAFNAMIPAVFGRLGGIAEPVAVVEDRIPSETGLECGLRVYRPQGEQTLPCVLYFHGGGFIMGDLQTADPACRALANAVPALVVSVGYRLAPEHPYPAANDDAVASLAWLRAHAAELGGDPGRIALAGDSAGATLAALLAIHDRDRGRGDVRQQTLVYPSCDGTGVRPSLTAFGDGRYGITAQEIDWFKTLYAAGRVAPDDPAVAPFRAARCAGLPPTLVITAEYDPLRDDGEAYAARLKEEGVRVKAIRFPGTVHGFFLMPGALHAATEAVAAAADHLRAALAAPCLHGISP